MCVFQSPNVLVLDIFNLQQQELVRVEHMLAGQLGLTVV